MNLHKGTDHEFVLRPVPSGGCWICYKETQRKINRAKTAEVREFAQFYKETKGCGLCGYAAHHAGLDFDHKQPVPNSKRSTFTTMRGFLDFISDTNIQVLCKTCHGIKTFENKDYRKKETV